MSYYSLGRTSVRWWRKVFFGVMEVVVVNSYILYSQNISSHRKLPHKKFRREVVMSLCAPLYNAAPTRERVQLGMSMERLRGRHFIDGGGPRRGCRVCSKRGVPGQRHLTTTFVVRAATTLSVRASATECTIQKSVYNSEIYIIYYSFTTLY